MPLYDEGLSRAKTWVNNYMMNQLAPNMGAGGMAPDMGPMGVQNPSMNLPSAPAPQTPTGGTPAKGGKSAPTVKPAPVPIPPRPQDNIAMGQLASVPDYVAKFLIDLSRKVLGLPEGGMQPPTENPAMGLPSGPSQGYRVAEGGRPEVVNAEGAYYPFESGQVTPLISRAGGGDVEPSETRYVERYNQPKPYDPFNPPPNIIDTGIKIPTQFNPPDVSGLGKTALGTGEYLGRIPMYLGAKGREIAESALGIEPISPRPSYMTSAGNLQRMEELLPGGPQLPTPTLSTFGYKTTPTVAPTIPTPKPGEYPIAREAGRRATVSTTPVPTLPSTPEGLAKWGITRDILPTGETRYTLPGTEGTMTLPSGWDATAEGQKVFGAMKPGYYSGVGERMEPPVTTPRSYYDAHPEERAMDIEALGTAPPRGMAEYEATVARGRMTKRERREASVGERELRKQTLINRGELERAKLQYGPTSPESQAQLATVEYHRARTQMEREGMPSLIAERIAKIRAPIGVTGGYMDPSTGKFVRTEEKLTQEDQLLEDLRKNSKIADQWGKETFSPKAFEDSVRTNVRMGKLPRELLKAFPTSKLIPEADWITKAKIEAKTQKQKFPDEYYKLQYQEYVNAYQNKYGQ